MGGWRSCQDAPEGWSVNSASTVASSLCPCQEIGEPVSPQADDGEKPVKPLACLSRCKLSTRIGQQEFL